MPAIIQEKLREINDIRVVLSEDVYKRLSYCINLCRLSMGKDDNEYGTILYGYRKGKDVIYFEKASEYDDYTPLPKRFNISSGKNMTEELIQNVIVNQNYNCFAHIHTHPYLESQSGGSRFLSQEDIDYYKSSFYFGNVSKNKKAYSFGGLLTVDKSNNQQTDDISFVCYDPNTDELCQIPNISVIINKKEISLKRVDAEFASPQTGERIGFKRTLLEPGKIIDFEKQSGYEITP